MKFTKDKPPEATCRVDENAMVKYRERLPQVLNNILENCDDKDCFTHVDYEPIPSKQSVVKIIDTLRQVVFPGYFGDERLDPVNQKFVIGSLVTELYDLLSEQISRSIKHDCLRYDQACSDCGDRGHEAALALLDSIPRIRRTLATDVDAAYDGDPAAKSYDEIIFCYPGLYAIFVYRVAHRLFELGVPLLPRTMTEYAHSLTGIDIHPGAEIGDRFVIDHGTGIVIGETTEIGNNVRIYQGVTLGALSLSKDAVGDLRGNKRHPTIKDDVIIYAGATLLGGDTVIGARSIIGGNVWITQSVPPDTRVYMEAPRLTYR